MSAQNDYRNKRNRAVCSRLITFLRKQGWKAVRADDESIEGMSAGKATEIVYQLDGARIWFEKDHRMHYVVYTGYNNSECDCIPDYSFSEGDSDGFMALLDSFTDRLSCEPYATPQKRKPAAPASVIGEVSPEDDALIAKIAARAKVDLEPYGFGYPMHLMMDLTCVHARTPLRLADLLVARHSDFAHDMIGIVQNLDRTKGELRNLFSPRYTA